MHWRAETQLRWAAALLCALCYAQTLKTTEFIRDDQWLIAGNPLLARGLGGLPALVSTGYVEAVEGAAAPIQEYRPLLSLSFLLQIVTTGMSAPPMHAANVALHIGVCLLLFELLRARLPLEAAAAATLLFAVLPVHAEAVSYITSRSELLSAFLMLAAWLALGSGRPRAAAGLALYFSAMLTKEHAVLFPALLILDDWVFKGVAPASRGRANIYMGLAACLAAYLALRAFVLSSVFHAGVPYFSGASPLVEALTVSRFVVEHYVWPSLTGLGFCADFTRPLIVDASPASLFAWACLAALASALALSLRGVFQRRPWAFWAAAPCLFLIPTCPLIVPIDTIGAERMLYFPTIGLCALMGLLYARFQTRTRKHALAAVLLWYAGCLMYRNRAWASELDYFEASIDCNPVCAKSRSALGAYLIAHGKPAAGAASLKDAIRLNPALAHPYYNLARLRWEEGDAAQAESLLRFSLKLEPGSADALTLLGLTLEAGGRLEEARLCYQKALEIIPWHPAANYDLGRNFLLGRRPDLALPYLERFIELAPRDPDAPKIAQLVASLKAAP